MTTLVGKEQTESLGPLLDDLSDSEFAELTEYLFSGDGGRHLLSQLLWPHFHAKHRLLTMELLTEIITEIKEDRETEDENQIRKT